MRRGSFLNRFFFIFWFYLFATIIPRPLQRIFTLSIGDVFYLLMSKTRRAVKTNLSLIGGQRWDKRRITTLARRTFRNYGQYLLDYMVMHRLTAETKTRMVERELGQEHMVEALKRGKGVICVTPHLGNWELGGLLLAFKGCDLYVLTLDEINPDIKAFREWMRTRKGIKNIYIDPENPTPAAILEVVKLLKKNKVVAMLGDRPGKANTIDLNFFGRKTRFPMGVATLAMATGAAVLPVFVVLRKGNKYRGIIEHPVYFQNLSREEREKGIRRGMAELVRIFEKYIGEYPDQWYNFFPYWP
ncbi:MAG: lysophospholipid acyltransferase family protein [Deltaproteobacteria bacterium]|nr:MAG: lysophospholipid acyltransferase family protein [Deltaproteobacteria bacterium]